jgi:hypothetical protein
MTTCQQALDEWRALDCVRYGTLCNDFSCTPSGPPPPGQPPPPTLPPPPLPPPPSGPCFGFECCPDGSNPPCQCPDGSDPPCIGTCPACPDGSIPAAPACSCTIQTCPDGSTPPCTVTLCAACANGSIPAAPECFCPCGPGEYPPPCSIGDTLDLGTGCCAPAAKQCGPLEHPPPCNIGDAIDLVTGCCQPAECGQICHGSSTFGLGPFASLLQIAADAGGAGAGWHVVGPFPCGSPAPGCG